MSLTCPSRCRNFNRLSRLALQFSTGIDAIPSCGNLLLSGASFQILEHDTFAHSLKIPPLTARVSWLRLPQVSVAKASWTANFAMWKSCEFLWKSRA